MRAALTDKIIDRLKKRPAVAVALIGSSVLLGVADVTGALTTLWTLIVPERPPSLVLVAQGFDNVPFGSARLVLRPTDKETTLQAVRLVFRRSLSRRPQVEAAAP